MLHCTNVYLDVVKGAMQSTRSRAVPERGSKPPGRPEEFHLQPPTEPPLDLHGSPLPCHLAMTVDAESDRSSRLPGWPSLSIRFAPRSLQALRRSYRMIRPRHAHRYFPPSCLALIRFSLRMA